MTNASVHFGIYSIIEKIGEGGFGNVYKAQDPRAEHPVALKAIRPDLCQNSEIQRSFLHEARLLRQLPANPHLVELLDYGLTKDRQPYLVMPLLAGEDLRDYLAGGRLPICEALEIIRQVVEALLTVVGTDAVHCDIKPENIRRLPDGCIRLMDFGIARMLCTPGAQIAGTPEYLAPEIWKGETPTPQSDIYALGCVFFEILTCSPPFTSPYIDRSRRIDDLRLQHTQIQPDLSPFYAHNVSSCLIDLLKSMLAKYPGKRPDLVALKQELQLLRDKIDYGAFAPEVPRHILEEDTLPRLEIGPEETIRHLIEQRRRIDVSDPHLATSDVSGSALVTFQQPFPPLVWPRPFCSAAALAGTYLLTADTTGMLVQVDLTSGQSATERSSQVKPDTTTWEMQAAGTQVIFHTGGMNWYLYDCERRTLIDEGTLPAAGGRFFAVGERWLYSTHREVYHASLTSPHGFAPIPLPSGLRITGSVLVRQGITLVPTSQGVYAVKLDGGEGRLFETDCRVSALVPLRGNSCVAVLPRERDGREMTSLRAYEQNGPLLALAAETVLDGQVTFPVSSNGLRCFLAMRGGCMAVVHLHRRQSGLAFEVQWYPSLEGELFESGLAFSEGLLAGITLRGQRAGLRVLAANSGQLLYQRDLLSDVYLPPIWSHKLLCAVSVSGQVEWIRAFIAEQSS